MTTRLDVARATLRFARTYTLRFLDALPADDWFRVPPAGVSHVAWQVGHLAFAQYRLALLRLRGERPDDANLLPPLFLQLFGAGSSADPDPGRYPPPDEIRGVFDRLHDRVLEETAGVPDAELDAELLVPHPICRTKGDCLHWCAHHEGVHAGQIGLLRRQLGHKPIW